MNYLDGARARFPFALWAPESDPAGPFASVFACLPPAQYACTFASQEAAEAWLENTRHNCPLNPGTPAGGKHFIYLSDEFVDHVHDLQDRARRELYEWEVAYESTLAASPRPEERSYPGMPPETLQALLEAGNLEFDAVLKGWHCDTLFNAGFELNEQRLVGLNWHGRELERMAHGEWSAYSRPRARVPGPQKKRKRKAGDALQEPEQVAIPQSGENPF